MIDSLAAPTIQPAQAAQARPITADAAAVPQPVARQPISPVYVSPVIRIDVETQQAVVEYRNSSTGEIENQYPSESQLRAYQPPAQATATHLVEEKS